MGKKKVQNKWPERRSCQTRRDWRICQNPLSSTKKLLICGTPLMKNMPEDKWVRYCRGPLNLQIRFQLSLRGLLAVSWGSDKRPLTAFKVQATLLKYQFDCPPRRLGVRTWEMATITSSRRRCSSSTKLHPPIEIWIPIITYSARKVTRRNRS